MGLSQDGRGSLEAVGSTAAHELGHIFSMDHDTPCKSIASSILPRSNCILDMAIILEACTCTDPSGVCIMAASSGRPSPVQWSSCSRDFIATGFSQDNLNSCLDNEPSVTVGDPSCGNGIREGDEICDCGTPEVCNMSV